MSLRSKSGIIDYDTGQSYPARFYYGDGESEPEGQIPVLAESHATWIEDDGVVGIRAGTSISVGASKAYSKNYDTVDWGN